VSEKPYQFSGTCEKQRTILALCFRLSVTEKYCEQSFQDGCLQNILYGRTHSFRSFWNSLHIMALQSATEYGADVMSFRSSKKTAARVQFENNASCRACQEILHLLFVIIFLSYVFLIIFPYSFTWPAA